MELIKGGIYQHYKGPLYKVIDVVRNSETYEFMVLYEALYENELGKLWVRPLNMFTEKIILDGKEVERFKLLKNMTSVDLKNC